MIETIKLNSGINMVMEKIPYVKSVSVGIWVRAGSADESDDDSGISHFIEHMMFKGTRSRSTKKIAEDVDKIGGQMNAFTGKEATCYYIKTLEANIGMAMDVLLDMFLNSVFDEEEMSKEKGVIAEEIKMIQDTPDEDIYEIICGLIFRDHPLARPVIGTQASVNSISRSQVRKYIKSRYAKDSIVISVSGNFSKDRICSLIEGRLSGLEEKKTCRTFAEKSYEPAFMVKVKDIEQSHICLGTRSIRLGDDDYYAFSCMNNIIGGSMSSRLFQKIREEKGLAYSVYSMNNSFSDTGYFNIYAGVGHNKMEEAIYAIKEELAAAAKTGVTREELSKAKEQLKSTYIFSQENVNGRMFAAGKDLTIMGKVYTDEEVISGIDAVTAGDVDRVTGMICDISRYSAAAITNRDIPLERIVRE